MRTENTLSVDLLPVDEVIAFANELAKRYEISSTRALVEMISTLASDDALNVAVVGRFKAGKSSFLNHFLNRELLPVGVVPVTSVVTVMSFGPREKASVHFINGDTQEIQLEEVRWFVTESKNPGNFKKVLSVSIEMPELRRMRSLRFIDLPGLESALTHNTEAVLGWLPNVGLALVAISVDPPLSQQDIDLLRSVNKYTPHVAILLTKIDLLSANELNEVVIFIREQLARLFQFPPMVYQYSVRPGFEVYKTRIEDQVIGQTLARFEERHNAALARKLETLLRESRDYLNLALVAAETLDANRESLKRKFEDQTQALTEVKSQLRLLVQHTTGGVRGVLARIFDEHHSGLSARLTTELQTEFAEWKRSLAFALDSYEGWLSNTLSKELMAVSKQEHDRVMLLSLPKTPSPL
jgi:GTP-binding protein EngB required for normal cell division